MPEHLRHDHGAKDLERVQAYRASSLILAGRDRGEAGTDDPRSCSVLLIASPSTRRSGS